MNLWAIPDIPDKNSGTDQTTKIHYPHFSSNEVHSDYIDCIQFYGDLILSRASQENRILLWQITDFSSDDYPSYDALPKAPGSKIGHSAFTLSAFGKGFQRLMSFKLPQAQSFYMRFSLFHVPNKRPMLCAGNTNSKVHWWDLQRLEEGQPTASRTTMLPSGSDIGDDGTNTSTPEYDMVDSIESLVDDAGFKKPTKRNREPESQTQRRGWIRGESHASNASSTSASTSHPSFPPPTGGKKGKGRGRGKTDDAAKYSIDDPIRENEEHRHKSVPNYKFAVRQVAWSPGGEWCVVCGDHGMIGIFGRWLKNQ